MGKLTATAVGGLLKNPAGNTVTVTACGCTYARSVRRNGIRITVGAGGSAR